MQCPKCSHMAGDYPLRESIAYTGKLHCTNCGSYFDPESLRPHVPDRFAVTLQDELYAHAMGVKWEGLLESV